MPFDLHPEYPPEGVSVDAISARYGFDLNEHHERLFGENGLPWTRHERLPSSHAALNATELARERGVGNEFHHAAMTGFWGEDRDIGDPDVLAAIGEPLGLDPGAVRDAARDQPYKEHIQAFTSAIYEMGGQGVPAFVIADKALIPGAQPHALFEKVMDRISTDH